MYEYCVNTTAQWTINIMSCYWISTVEHLLDLTWFQNGDTCKWAPAHWVVMIDDGHGSLVALIRLNTCVMKDGGHNEKQSKGDRTEVSYFTCTSCACPTCDNCLVVGPAQPDPSELLHLMALRVPLHHIGCMCSSTVPPGDGDTVVTCSVVLYLQGVDWKRKCTCECLTLGSVLLMCLAS